MTTDLNEPRAGHTSKRRKILVVEDERLVARELEHALSDMGYEVTGSVATGDAALESVRTRRPDVVLMDVRIKGQLDGIDTADALSQKYGVPVVFLTAYGDDETLSRATRVGPYGYVIKPFSSQDVRSAIEVAAHKHAANRSLAERERWFSTTLRSIGDAVVACDVEGRVEFMNPVAEGLTGWSESEAKGRPFGDVIRMVSHGNESVENPAARAMREGAVQSLPPSTRLLDREGRAARFIDDAAAPIVYRDAILGAVLVFRDVTEKKRLEDQLALTDRLSSLGVLAASVGHEINNPLTYNLANLSFAIREVEELRKLAQSDELRGRLTDLLKPLAEAAEGGERVAKVVSDLRIFSRAEGQALRRIDVRGCIEWALKLAGGQVNHVARVTQDIRRVPRVMANEVRLSQVFVNLFVNAAQAIQGPYEDNEIRVVARTSDAGQVVVEVTDTGLGIPEEVRSRIFEPFFTTKQAAGNGLGLSVSRDIIEWLGGTLTVESSPERGTTFRVVLPAAEDEGPVEPTRAPPLVQERPVRVLAVDDDVTLGRTIHRVLHDHDVTIVQNARDALALIREERPFDVILCDIMMPDMTGMDFYEELEKRVPKMARRVAFMTGGAFSARAIQFLRAGTHACIPKPFSAESLQRFVAELTAKRAREP